MENEIAAAIGILLLYLTARFVVFEIMTVVLRRVPAARAWFQAANARGWLLRETRSRALFTAAIRKVALGLEWLTGKGFIRGATFAFVAGVAIFLSTLPLSQVNGAAAEQYAALRAQGQDSNAAEKYAATLCAQDNIIREIERERGEGRLFKLPPGYSLYPVDDPQATLQGLMDYNDRGWLFLQEFHYGRALTDRISDIPLADRQNPVIAQRIAQDSRNGKLTAKLANLSPLEPAHRAYVDDVAEFCWGQATPAKTAFKPVRPLADYQRMVEVARSQYLAFLDDEGVRRAYVFFQQKLVTGQVAAVFFSAMGGGFLLLLSVKLAIVICRALPSRAWVVVNIVLANVMGVAAATLVVLLLSGWTSVSQAVSPMALYFTVKNPPGTQLEAEYRAHADHVLAKAVQAKTIVCGEVGDTASLDVACDVVTDYFKPWNPATKHFDYGAMIPRKTNGTPNLPDKEVEAMRRSTLSLMTAYAAIGPREKTARETEKVVFWGGVGASPIYYVVVAPLLGVGVLAMLLLPWLELRTTVVKRVRRIVNGGAAPVAAGKDGG